MKGLKINVKEIATKTAGNAAGLVLVGQVNKIGFIASKSPMIRGLITLGIGRIALPYIGSMLGLAGKKGGALIEGAEEAVSTYAVAQLGSNFPATANLFPKISGYEDNVYGLGMVTQEEVTGYEDNVYGANDSVEGTEDIYN